MIYNLPQYMSKLNFEDKTFNMFCEQQRVKKYLEKTYRLNIVFPLNKAGCNLFKTHAHVNSEAVLKLFGKWDDDIVRFLK
jgi:hypothetical protein